MQFDEDLTVITPVLDGVPPRADKQPADKQPSGPPVRLEHGPGPPRLGHGCQASGGGRYGPVCGPPGPSNWRPGPGRQEAQAVGGDSLVLDDVSHPLTGLLAGQQGCRGGRVPPAGGSCGRRSITAPAALKRRLTTWPPYGVLRVRRRSRPRGSGPARPGSQQGLRGLLAGTGRSRSPGRGPYGRVGGDAEPLREFTLGATSRVGASDLTGERRRQVHDEVRPTGQAGRESDRRRSGLWHR
jgi:hypothetical protein